MVFHDIGRDSLREKPAPLRQIFLYVLILTGLKSLVFVCADFKIVSGVNFVSAHYGVFRRTSAFKVSQSPDCDWLEPSRPLPKIHQRRLRQHGRRSKNRKIEPRRNRATERDGLPKNIRHYIILSLRYQFKLLLTAWYSYWKQSFEWKGRAVLSGVIRITASATLLIGKNNREEAGSRLSGLARRVRRWCPSGRIW